MVEVTALYIYIVINIYSLIYLHLRTLLGSFRAIIFRKIAKMYLKVPGLRCPEMRLGRSFQASFSIEQNNLEVCPRWSSAAKMLEVSDV